MAGDSGWFPIFLFFILFIYLFLAALGFGCLEGASHCDDFPSWGGWALRQTGSVVAVPGFSFSTACDICLDEGSNPRPLHWQVDSYPLHH